MGVSQEIATMSTWLSSALGRAGCRRTRFPASLLALVHIVEVQD
jgi:hypothetical protein